MSGSVPDPDGQNNAATATVPLVQSADLQISKTAAFSATAGTNTVFTITIHNAGPSMAFGAVISDAIPPGLTFLSASGGCNAYPCTLAQIAAGQTIVVVNTYAIPAGYTAPDPISNSATVTSTTLDPTPLNSDTAAVPLATSANLVIAKTGAPNAVPGTATTFTVTVRNDGPSVARDVTVSDPTPPGLTFVSASGACAVFPCSIGDLAVGQVITIASTYAVPAAYTAPDPIANSATVTSTTTDPVGPNGVTTTVPLAPHADLVINKLGATLLVAGQPTLFTITVRNDGPSVARDVTVSDPTPAGLTFASNGGACATAYPCALGNLAVGQAVTIVSTYDVPASYQAPDPITNSAAVTSTTPDLGGSNEVSITVPLTTSADLEIDKTASPFATAGLPTVFTVTVRNLGVSDARNVIVSDPAPAGLTFVGATGSCAAFPCSVGTLASGAVITMVSTYAVPSGYLAPDLISNQATVTSSTPDPNGPNEAIATLPLTTTADLVINKLGDALATPGTNTVFTLTVRNDGPSDARDVTLDDPTPNGLTFIGASGACTAYPCGIGTLVAGATITVVNTYAVPANYQAPDPISNSATVSSTTMDPTGPNGVTTTVPLTTSADLVISKVASAQAIAGESTVFTVTVHNAGPSDARAVTVSDPTPPGLSFVEASGACTAYPCEIGTVSAGETITIVSTYDVPATYLSPNPIANAATVTSTTADPGSPNVVTATVPLTTFANLVIDKIGDAHATAGQATVYTITVRNEGPSVARNVTVNDSTPSGLTFVRASGACIAFVCSAGDLAVGQTITIVSTYDVPADYQLPDPIANTAQVTSTTADPQGLNVVTATTPLALNADLVIAKLGETQAVPGTNTVFTITVRNAGPSDARNVTVSDPAPVGTLFVSNKGACATAYPCGLGTLAPGQLMTITSSYLVLANYLTPDPLANTASVTSTTPDANGPNVVTTTLPVAPSADLVISKLGSSQAVAGQPTVFTVTVRNDGPSYARDVTISDPTPAGLTFASASGACAAFPCSLGTLAPGQVMTIASTYDVPASYLTPDPIANTATVTSTTADPTGPNRAVAAVPLTTTADLVINKLASPSALAGQSTAFTITVRNDGPSDARGVTISDPLPSGLIWQSNTGSCGTAYPCSVGTLAIGQAITIVSTYAVPASYTAPDPIANSATVTSTTIDPTGPNSITATVPLITAADLVIDKLGSTQLVAGQPTLFTITVRNDGPSVARDVTISDPTPADLIFASNSGDCATAYPCVLGDLAVGQAITITSLYTVPASYEAPDPISNSATVTSTTPDPTGANAITVTVPLTTSADLFITKIASPQSMAGLPTVFTITVRNLGSSDARNVVISDPPPPGLIFSGNSGDCTTAYSCAIGTLNAGAVITIVSVYTVPASYLAPDPIANTARVSSTTPDPNGPNEATTTSPLTTSADLVIAKFGDALATPGTNAVFTITVRNDGPSDARDVTLNDPTPAGLTFVGASGACAAYPCSIGTLAAGTSITVVNTYAVPASYQSPDPIANSATVTSTTADPNGPNDVTATVPLTTSANLVINKFASPQPIAGQSTVFTVTVRNDGPSDARDVIVSDPIPAGLSFVGASGACTAYPCAIGTLSAGDVITIVSTYDVPATYLSPDPITNSAMVTSTTVDPSGPNVITVTAALSTSADLVINKTGSPQAAAGLPTVFTITVSNSGPSVARDVIISDPTPFGLTFVDASGPCASYPCALGDLAVGQMITIVGTYDVPAGYQSPDPIANTATVTSTTADPTGPNVVTATVLLAFNADLVIAKVSDTQAVPGTNTVFTITVRNAGPSDARDVTVSDPAPVGTLFVSNGGACATAYPCSLGTLAPGQLVTITSTYLVLANYLLPDPLANTASVTSTTPDAGGPNVVTTTLPVAPSADLVIAKLASPQAVAGQQTVFTITVRNDGPSYARNVTVSDPVPAGLTFVSASGACASFPCSLGTLTPGQVITIANTYDVPAGYLAPDPIANSATVTSTTADPSSSNVITATVPLTTSANLVLAKFGASAAMPGTETVFTVTLRNDGPSDARDVVISDPTPPGLTFVGASGACASYPCEFGTLIAGQAITIVSTYAVPSSYVAPDPIANSATISSTTPDPIGPNVVSTTVPVAPSADLIIAKRGDASASPGTAATFTITVRNAGASDALNVTVTDPTPPGLTFVANSGDCATAYPCVIGTLAAGQLITIVSTYDVPADYLAPDPIANSATVTSTTPDPSGPNVISATIPLASRADLVINKIASPQPTAGLPMVFTITVRNDGPAVARAVMVDDPTPPGLQFAGAGGGCLALPCAIGDLTVGQIVTITSAYTVPAGYLAPNPISNSATVTSTTTDPNGPNTAVVTETLTTTADLVIAKLGEATAIPGTETTFTVTVRNFGPSDARAVTVSDPTPAGLVFIANSGACATAFPCGLGTVTAGQAITIVSTYRVPVEYLAPDPIANNATVTSTTADPNGPNSAAVTVPVVPTADLQINKLGAGAAIAGTSTAFTITVYNAGPSIARAVTVTDPTPPGLTFSGSSGACSDAFPCALGDLAPGALVTIVSTFSVPAGYLSPATITNTASIASATFDPAGPNTVSAGVPLTTSADLVIAKSGDPIAVPGTRTTYTITVRNLGASDAQNVVIADPLPDGLTFVGASGACTAFPCDIGTLASGAAITIVSVYDVDTNYGVIHNNAPITNTATVASSTADPTWPNPASFSTPLFAVADLALSKSIVGSPALIYGHEVTFSIVLTNYGPSAATGVAVSETLPAGLTYVASTATRGTYDDAAGLWTVGGIRNGDVVTLTLIARVEQLGAIANMAQVARSDQLDPDATAGNSVPGEDDQASATLIVTETPALLLAKRAIVVDNGDATYNVTYVLVVSNTGDVPVSGLRLTDTLSNTFASPARFGVIAGPSASAGIAPNPAFDGAANAQLLTGSDTLPVGAAMTMSFTARVTPALTETYANTAAVSGSGPGGTSTTDLSNSGDTPSPGDAPTTITLPIADLRVVKTVSVPRPNIGDVFSYVVRIDNAGPSLATGIVLTEALPAAVTYLSHATSQGAFAAANGLWTVGTLGNDGSAVLTMTVRMNATGVTTNSVRVLSPVADPNVANNLDTQITPAQQSDLKLSKRVAPLSAAIGQEITYTIVLTNNGRDAATNVIVRDELPSGVVYVRADASQGVYDPIASDWAVGRLNDDVVATLRIVARVTAAKVLTNTAEVINMDQFDPNATPGNHVRGEDDQADASLVGLGVPVLALTKHNANNGVVRTGNLITYTLMVENLGSGPATNVIIVDAVPDGTIFASASDGGAVGNGVARWQIGTLAPNAMRAVTLVVRVTATRSATSIRNVASVSGDGPVGEAVAASNEVQNAFAPTAIALDAFTAIGDPSSVTIAWRTALELNTLGFNLWRSAGDRADGVKLNAALIAARNTAGASYAFEDAAPISGARYWLEEIELSGARTEYGPISVAQPIVVSDDGQSIAIGMVRLRLTEAQITENANTAVGQSMMPGHAIVAMPGDGIAQAPSPDMAKPSAGQVDAVLVSKRAVAPVAQSPGSQAGTDSSKGKAARASDTVDAGAPGQTAASSGPDAVVVSLPTQVAIERRADRVAGVWVIVLFVLTGAAWVYVRRRR